MTRNGNESNSLCKNNVGGALASPVRTTNQGWRKEHNTLEIPKLCFSEIKKKNGLKNWVLL